MFRMLIPIIELAACVIVIILVAQEVVIPLVTKKPMFPLFRSWGKGGTDAE